ncbi:prepilin-type N-terminal cleavage/methylation domain-containing protein [bacterium]|nr:prepilin-type N-terminal cleavage/methylation domain-containing protein [bacterium]
MMRKALTTAELMVALTIVGVIAVLVLPSMVQNYHKKIYVSKLQKTYMELSNAVEQACADNNVSSFFYTPYAARLNNTQTKAFFKKYMKVKSEVSGFSSFYKAIDGSSHASYIQGSPVMLSGGQAISMVCDGSGNPTRTCYVFLDINGKEEPNMAGRDMFTFSINARTNEIYDWFGEDKCLSGNAKIGSTNAANGGGCLAKILKSNWKMEY